MGPLPCMVHFRPSAVCTTWSGRLEFHCTTIHRPLQKIIRRTLLLLRPRPSVAYSDCKKVVIRVRFQHGGGERRKEEEEHRLHIREPCGRRLLVPVDHDSHHDTAQHDIVLSTHGKSHTQISQGALKSEDGYCFIFPRCT